MMVLPKLLFLFQNLTILLIYKYFKDLDSVTLKFVWKTKKPRIKLRLLQDLKERGGSELPNWLLYYKAYAMTWIKE